jgi:hypothetical protein
MQNAREAQNRMATRHRGDKLNVTYSGNSVRSDNSLFVVSVFMRVRRVSCFQPPIMPAVSVLAADENVTPKFDTGIIPPQRLNQTMRLSNYDTISNASFAPSICGSNMSMMSQQPSGVLKCMCFDSHSRIFYSYILL